MFKFLGHRNFVLPLAFILGLSCPHLAECTKSINHSHLSLGNDCFHCPNSHSTNFALADLIKPLIIGIFFNYLILGSLLLISSYRCFFSFDIIF